jgi:hypothetical protein
MASLNDSKADPLLAMDFQWAGTTSFGIHEYGITVFSIGSDGAMRLILTQPRSAKPGENGAGIWMLNMTPEHRQMAEELRASICGDHSTPPPFTAEPGPPPGSYSVHCKTGVVKVGLMRLLSEAASSRMVPLQKMLIDSVYRVGRNVEKLDIEATVVPQPYNFLVTIRLINTGEHDISIIGASLGLGGRYPLSPNIGAAFAFDLSDVPMLNADHYLNGPIIVPPGMTRELTYLAAPEGKYLRGTYDFFGVFSGAIGMQGGDRDVYPASFSSSRYNRISIDRDYPATPQEWQDYEEQHRKKMLDWPVLAGTLFKEDGYYRPVGAGGAQGRFVTRFVKGAKAPDASDQQDDQGNVMDAGPHKWLWVADISSVIEGHGKFPCPKSGRWLAKIPNDVPNAGYFLSRVTIMQLKQGEMIPSIGLASAEDEARVRWEWIGP